MPPIRVTGMKIAVPTPKMNDSASINCLPAFGGRTSTIVPRTIPIPPHMIIKSVKFIVSIYL